MMDEIAKLADICIEKRITRIKYKEIEFELELPPTEAHIKAAEEIAAIMERQSNVSDEDILMDPMAGLTEKG